MSFLQPLSVHYLWHPDNKNELFESIQYCANLMNRDPDRPYSRTIKVPTFFNTSTTTTPPKDIPVLSEKTVIFLFISKYIVIDEKWCSFIQRMCSIDSFRIVPIAVDDKAFNIPLEIKTKNFIRAFQFDINLYKENLLLSISHELYRLGLNEEFNTLELGAESSVKLFLSHAKDNGVGVGIANQLKSFIDNTSLNNFFDTTDIAPGYLFNEEIKGHIAESTLIAIHSDTYSNRYWCQKEVQYTKELLRPMIAVDSVELYEDRKFPLSSNIPSIRVSATLDRDDLLKIVTFALLETIRFFYSKKLLNCYKNNNWFSSESVILTRPPEISDLCKFETITTNNDGVSNIFIYPEPPVYKEELAPFEHLGIKSFTPLNTNVGNISGLNIGISISEPEENNLLEIGQSSSHLKYLSQDIARHLLSQKGVIVYGGDLRIDGFTDFLISEAQALKSRINSEDLFIKNYLSWPIYLEDKEEVINWKARSSNMLKMIEVPFEAEIEYLIPNTGKFLPPDNTKNSFIWSKCLTKMRNELISNCHIRICAGGKHNGYKGKMPGVLEEILISIDQNKPIFLLGGFGGVCQSVSELLLSNQIPLRLKEVWQKENNAGYTDLLSKIKDLDPEYHPKYGNLLQIITLEKLNNGLDESENIVLFKTPFIDEALHLIFLGISRLKQKSKL
ncbi:hypothetical protein ACRN9A_17540 [Shewanella frigidimarina]|uniref:hypothetical protein n=1 Tax=Shewanella frigidimarina TaxID=56812 RepID=UPI003D79D35A